MTFDIAWYIGVPIIAIEVFILYRISKVYERQLDEQQERELQELQNLTRHK